MNLKASAQRVLRVNQPVNFRETESLPPPTHGSKGVNFAPPDPTPT